MATLSFAKVEFASTKESDRAPLSALAECRAQRCLIEILFEKNQDLALLKFCLALLKKHS
jgi:hypothetical protein